MPVPVDFPRWTGEFASADATPGDNCGIRVGEPAIVSAVRRHRRHAARGLQRYDLADGGEWRAHTDAEIHRAVNGVPVSIDEDVLPIECEAVGLCRRIHRIEVLAEHLADASPWHRRTHAGNWARVHHHLEYVVGCVWHAWKLPSPPGHRQPRVQQDAPIR